MSVNGICTDVPPAVLLEPEWERLLLLAYCLAQSRHGQGIADADIERLRRLKTQVDTLRTPRGVWEQALGRLPSSAECDVLAAVAAPEFESRVGWAYQELQHSAHGGGAPFPSRALLQELLALDAGQAQPLRRALAPDGWLRRGRMLRVEAEGAYQPLVAEPGLLARLSGGTWQANAPPGADCIAVHASWDDLVLPPHRLAILKEFLLWIEQRRTVVEEWGGQAVGGPVALFAGPSGTGKTFAASVIATHLGWQLYRVDLGRVVSKYVGETEQNLNRLFEAAHGQPVLLQFDEADALFAKRGEVKEARDRYANMEVSHLLTRIEAHQGPCILTTNLRRQLDAAFTRRIQVVIEFPRPDTAGRAALWQRLLPPQAPRAADVDCTMLASCVTLTGGQIRNAALHAAYLAAGEGVAIALRHIALAVWRELGKDGREISRNEIGALSVCLPVEFAPAELADEQ